MKQELEKAKKELEDSKKTLEEYESKANYEVSEKQKVEAEYKKKLQTVETKLQGLKRKQKVRKSRAVVSFHKKNRMLHPVSVFFRVLNPAIRCLSNAVCGFQRMYLA